MELTNLAAQQPLIYQSLKRSFAQQRLGHAYLFAGSQGTGKQALALWLAQLVFCTHVQANDPCQQCNNCQRIAANEHPDVLQIVPDGQSIKVGQIRELKAEFSKSGMEAARKIFIIHDAEKMNTSAANSLLKFLEEPDGQVIALLQTTALPKILPTIQSRCQIMHFQPLAKAQVVASLVEKGCTTANAQLLAELTNDLEQAWQLAQDDWFKEARSIQQTWTDYLVKQDWQAFVFVQKKLVPLFKEKRQQGLALDLVLIMYRRACLSQPTKQHWQRLTTGLPLILQAKQKWEANVSFQSVCEQLALRLLRITLE